MWLEPQEKSLQKIIRKQAVFLSALPSCLRFDGRHKQKVYYGRTVGRRSIHCFSSHSFFIALMNPSKGAVTYLQCFGQPLHLVSHFQETNWVLEHKEFTYLPFQEKCYQ